LCRGNTTVKEVIRRNRLSNLGTSLATTSDDERDACRVEEELAVNSITELEMPTDPEMQTQPEMANERPGMTAEAGMEDEADISEAATESAVSATTESAASGDEGTMNRCEDTAQHHSK